MRKKDVLKELGKRIRNERRRQGYSQEKFALETNLDRSYYGSIERGERNITFFTICEIAAKLKQDVAFFTRGIPSGDERGVESEQNHKFAPRVIPSIPSSLLGSAEDPVVQYLLGNQYYSGYGVEQSLTKAIEWYTKSVEQGNEVARTCLLLLQLEECALAEDPEAQYQLGDKYYNGEGLPQSYELAFYWYLRSAAHSHHWGQFNVAKCYEHGHGVFQSWEQAKEWYGKSAAQGNEWAQKALNHKK